MYAAASVPWGGRYAQRLTRPPTRALLLRCECAGGGGARTICAQRLTRPPTKVFVSNTSLPPRSRPHTPLTTSCVLSRDHVSPPFWCSDEETRAIEADTLSRLAAIEPILRHTVQVKLVRNERKNFINIRIKRHYIPMMHHHVGCVQL